jgi:hypothetical protein
MAEFSELVQALTWLLTNRIQQKIDYIHGLLGDGNGRVRVSTIPGSPEVDFVFVRPDRFSNRTFKVFNKRIEGQDGDPVIIGELPWEPGLVQVVDMDWAAYADVGWGDDVTTTNRHGGSHQWRDGAPGIDTFNVYRRQLGDLKTYPAVSGTLNVGVSPYSLDLYGKQYQWPGTQNFSLEGALPTTTGTARMAMVYWSPASGTTQGYLGVATGTLGGDSPPTILNRPVTPEGAIPSAFVRLAGGQTSITEFDIWDAREPFRPGIQFGTGTAGLSADMIPISDISGLYTGSTVEAALDEIGFDGARVSKVYQSGFGATSLEADAVGDLAVQGSGTFAIPDDLAHVGDADTRLIFGDDQIDAAAGDVIMMRLDEDAQDTLYLGDVAQTGDVDVNVYSDHLIVQPTTDTTTAVRFLDTAGTTTVLNVDAINTGLGLGTEDVSIDVRGITRRTNMYIETSKNYAIVAARQNDNANNAPAITFARSRADETASVDGDVLANINFAAHDGTDYNLGAIIQAKLDGTVVANTVPSAMIFLTTSTSSTPSERMRIAPDGVVTFSNDVTLAAGSQDYLLTNRSVNLSIEAQSSGSNSILELFAADGDGTDSVGFNFFGVGTADSTTNRERMLMQYTASATQYEIATEADGSGTLRDLVIYTEGNTDQLKIETGGNVSMTGALELAEMSAPGGGAANTARLYAVDNGAGKTQLVVVFNTGAAQVLATEP